MAEFYSAGSETIPPLPWSVFAPPLTHDFVAALGVLSVGDQVRQLRQALNDMLSFHHASRSDRLLTVFSCKDLADVKSLGGMGWFKLALARVEKCKFVVLYHNSVDPRKPGDPRRHRMPFLIGRINGCHVDPRDGCVAVRISEAAYVDGQLQENPGRSPVSYIDAKLIEQLKISDWEVVAPTTIEQAVQDRLNWEATAQRRLLGG